MKTRSGILAILALFIVAIGSAAELPKMNVVQLEADKALLAYSAPTATPLEITLTNHNGDILYSNRTDEKHSEYKKVFDLSGLGDGDFCLSVNFGNQSVTRSLQISGKNITVGPPQNCYVPRFHLENKTLDISFLNSGMKQVYLNIYRDGKFVEVVKLGRDLAIQKRLDMSNLKKGEYMIVLSEKHKEHTFIAKL